MRKLGCPRIPRKVWGGGYTSSIQVPLGSSHMTPDSCPMSLHGDRLCIQWYGHADQNYVRKAACANIIIPILRGRNSNESVKFGFMEPFFLSRQCPEMAAISQRMCDTHSHGSQQDFLRVASSCIPSPRPRFHTSISFLCQFPGEGKCTPLSGLRTPLCTTEASAHCQR